MSKMEDAFTGVNKTKLGMIKKYLEDELENTYQLLTQRATDLNEVGRHQGKAEYLQQLIQQVEYIKNNKKVVDKR